MKKVNMNNTYIINSNLANVNFEGASMENIGFAKTFYSINTKWPKSLTTD